MALVIASCGGNVLVERPGARDNGGPAVDSPWPMWRGTSALDGRFRGTGPAEEPLLERRIWDGGYQTAVSIDADGTLYATAAPAGMVALTPSGAVKWSFDGGFGTPALARDGTIYVAGRGGVTALDRGGNIEWTRPVGVSVGSPTLGADGTIYAFAGVGGTTLVAIRPDGTTKWRTELAEPSSSKAVAASADGTVYLTTRATLHAFASSGVEKWHVDLPGETAASPSVAPDGTVYVTPSAGPLMAVHGDGTVAWTAPLNDGDVEASTAALGPDGAIYVATCATFLYAFRPDGRRAWTHYVRFLACESPREAPFVVDASGMVLMGTYEDGILALRPDGTKAWSVGVEFAALWSLAPSADGRLYVGGAWGHLNVLER